MVDKDPLFSDEPKNNSAKSKGSFPESIFWFILIASLIALGSVLYYYFG